jgi:hypothetical protein
VVKRVDIWPVKRSQETHGDQWLQSSIRDQGSRVKR